MKLIQPRKEPCSAKLRYVQDVLHDLRRLLDTVDARAADQLSEMVAQAEEEACRQVERFQADPPRPTAIAPRPRNSAWERVLLRDLQQSG